MSHRSEFIRGDQEPKENYPAERFKDNCAGPCEVVIVIVTGWLKETVG